jgi:hypothetical protein
MSGQRLDPLARPARPACLECRLYSRGHDEISKILGFAIKSFAVKSGCRPRLKCPRYATPRSAQHNLKRTGNAPVLIALR